MVLYRGLYSRKLAKQELSIDTQGHSPVKESAIKKFLGIIVIAVVLSFASIGLAVYYIARFFYSIAARLFFSITDIITYTMKVALERIMTTIVTVGIVAGGLWLFWEMNPELERKVDDITAQANELLQKYAQISIPNIPDLEDIFDMFSKGKNSATIREFSTLFDEIGAKNIPKELEPILNIIQDRSSINDYKKLLESGGMGKNAEGAIPLLAESLRGNNPSLQGAALQALKMINSPDAKTELLNYQKLIENMVKNGQ